MAELAWPRLQRPSPHILRLTCHRTSSVATNFSRYSPAPFSLAAWQVGCCSSRSCAQAAQTHSQSYLRHRRRGARHQLMTARQSPILPVVTAAGSHHLACRCRRSRLQLRWVAEEQSRLLDRLFHACTFGLGHLLAPGTPVPAGGHLSAPTETSPTSAAPVSRRETGAAPRYANTASPFYYRFTH